MNIFYLDPCPRQSALWHNDRHEVKMILESGQMLSAVLHRHGIEDDRLYKLTHKNHPSTLWAGDSFQHFWWLQELFYWLNEQRMARGKPSHKTYDRLWKLVSSRPVWDLFDVMGNSWTPPPLCMPDEFKTLMHAEPTGDAEASHCYRNYYTAKCNEWLSRDKPLKIEYTGRDFPYWLQLENDNETEKSSR